MSVTKHFSPNFLALLLCVILLCVIGCCSAEERQLPKGLKQACILPETMKVTAVPDQRVSIITVYKCNGKELLQWTVDYPPLVFASSLDYTNQEQVRF